MDNNSTATKSVALTTLIKEFNLDEKVYQYRAVLSSISKAKDAMTDPEKYYASRNKKKIL